MPANHIFHRSALTLAAVAAFVCTGVCAQDPPKFTGFLGDYSQLRARPDPALVYHYTYIDPQAVWKAYDGVLIDPVKVVLKAEAQSAGFNPRDIQAISEYFEQAFLRELGKDYPVRQEQRPGLLRLRIAITGLAPTETRKANGVDFLPLMLFARAMKGRSIDVKVGSVAIEGELIDAGTGKRLAAVASRKQGDGVDEAGEHPATWEEVQEAMDFWAKRLRAFLDGARAGAR